MEASWLPALRGHRGCAAAPKQPVPRDHPELPRLNHSWDCVWSFQLLCLLWTHREKVKPPMARGETTHGTCRAIAAPAPWESCIPSC